MSTTQLEALAQSVTATLGDAVRESRVERGELSVEVDPARIVEVCGRLKRTPELAFTQLSDLSAVDYLTWGQADWQTERASSAGFSRGVARATVSLAYQLLSIGRNQRLRVKVYLDGDPPRIDTVSELWPVADWYEREAFDLFGILFDGHPDLRRILTDYGFIGHPFRKDFPLEGYVEVRYDPARGRVVNQPVSIEPRTLVPRVIREETWVHSSKPASGDA
jgi:NADH-quinone oxidoreductase subunit C